MAQYLLSVWHDDEYVVDFSGEEIQQRVARVQAFNTKLTNEGALVFGGGLNPASSATTLRPNGDTVSTTEGPYSSTKQQIGGFWVIEAPDHETALEWSKEAALACGENLELRPFQ